MDSNYLDLCSSTISQVEFSKSMMLTLCMKCAQQLRLLNKNTKALRAPPFSKQPLSKLQCVQLLGLFPIILGSCNCGLTLCSESCWAPMESKAQRAVTRKGYFHLPDTGTYESVAALCGQREKYPFNMYLLSTLIFWKLFKALGREKWDKVKCLPLKSLHFSDANKYLYLYLNLYINICLYISFTVCVCIQLNYT